MRMISAHEVTAALPLLKEPNHSCDLGKQQFGGKLDERKSRNKSQTVEAGHEWS